jgi:hypothetical protein
LCSRKKRSYLNGDLFGGSFPLGSWRCTKVRTFLLSEVELMRVGSIVAYLGIRARVVDLNPRAEIGPTTL